MSQLTLVGTKHDPAASDRMDIAVADLFLAMHSQSDLLNALSSNSYSTAQDSYLLLILLLIGQK